MNPTAIAEWLTNLILGKTIIDVGENIYPSVAPDETSNPLVIYQVMGAIVDQALRPGTAHNAKDWLFQIRLFADSSGDAWKLAGDLGDAITEACGVDIGGGNKLTSSTITNFADIYEPKDNSHGVAFGWQVSVD